MNTQKFIIFIAIGAMVLTLAGCQEGSRRDSAQRKWDRVMEQARIEAAQESIQQGRLAYAKRILQDVIRSDSDFSDQARQLLELVEELNQQFTAARSDQITFADMPRVN